MFLIMPFPGSIFCFYEMFSVFGSQFFITLKRYGSTYLGPAEKEVMQTEPVQVIVLILAGAPKTTPGTLPICPLVEIPKGFSGP